MTFLGALRHDRLAAPCLFDGPVNGECFRAYVEQLLLPSLKPGDIVIMDNLGSHKSVALRRIIKAAPGSGICRLTRPISIRSSRPSPTSSTGSGCAPPQKAPSTTSAATSATLSTPSNLMNAKTTSPTLDTLQSKRETLSDEPAPMQAFALSF